MSSNAIEPMVKESQMQPDDNVSQRSSGGNKRMSRELEEQMCVS